MSCEWFVSKGQMGCSKEVHHFQSNEEAVLGERQSEASASLGEAQCLKRAKDRKDGAGVRSLLDDFELEASTEDSSSSNEELFMPACVNLHEAGLRRSKRIKERKDKAVNHKAHVTFSTRIKKVVSAFTLLCAVSEYTMPAHRLPPNPTLATKLLNRLDEANEHCDGTLNEMNFMSLATNASNEAFTYSQAQKQEDWPMFVEAMEKEIADHELREH